MKIRFGVLLLLLAIPMIGYGQTTLNFPRAFTASDLGATGFAVVNPGSSAASLTFTLYNSSGTAVGTSSQSVPAGGQIARVGTELFPSVSQAGWVQMTSSASGLQGFWLGGDFASFTDGAEAAPGSADVIFPLVTSNTEINVANMSSSNNTVSIRIFGADGAELATAVSRTISGNGVLQSQASALFPSANLDNARYIRVTGSASVCGTAVISGFLVTPSWGVTNAIPASASLTEANFPHVVSGSGDGGNYTTIINVTSLSSSSQSVSITFTPATGSATTVTRTIPANGSLRETAQSLFSFTSYQNGWVKVTGTAMTAFAAYADSVTGGLAVVPAQTAPLSRMFFRHIAELAPWWTGVALLNPSTTAATVEVYMMTPAGALIGGADNVTTARFSLAGGQKIARLLFEWVPGTATRTSDGGFVFIRSSVPLYGMQLFFTRSLAVISSISAGDAGSYTPPGVVLPPTLTSITSRAARGDSVTLTGTNFSTTASSNTVLFAGPTGTVSGTVTAATATSLTVTVPATAISGPVLVQVGGQSTTSRVLEVTLAGGVPLSAATATTSTIAAGGTTSNVDIYVPSAAGTLNATEIAVFDVGSTSISFSGSSAEISRGQTKELAINGAGISSGAGTTIEVSGSGVTVSQVRYSGTFVYMRVVVDATAATGVRNVTIKNTNNDVSVMTGGLFIR